MCGRFTLKSNPKLLQTALGLPAVPDIKPRYNVSPSQLLLAVRSAPDTAKEMAFLRWGLVPSWSDDPAIANKLINARSETVQTKPSFRTAFKRRRCLIAADGFFEWQKLDAKKKQPYWIHEPKELPFFFAGLWERRERDGEEPLETCTILTTTANNALRHIHDRMPVILRPDAADDWLAPAAPADALVALLTPCPDDYLTATAVSDRVNSPRHDDPSCIKPVDGGLFA